ncbi:hypothetical protein TNCV_3432791 [Trichonephila clavipes]|nr:hypothetical protein TNCV_3432791 [Trichonephila clavipes]
MQADKSSRKAAWSGGVRWQSSYSKNVSFRVEGYEGITVKLRSPKRYTIAMGISHLV